MLGHWTDETLYKGTDDASYHFREEQLYRLCLGAKIMEDDESLGKKEGR